MEYLGSFFVSFVVHFIDFSTVLRRIYKLVCQRALVFAVIESFHFYNKRCFHKWRVWLLIFVYFRGRLSIDVSDFRYSLNRQNATED